MKLFIPAIILFLSMPCLSQAQPSFPEKAEPLFNSVIKGINPRHAQWIKKTARDVNTKSMNETQVKTEVTQYAVLANINNADIEALCFLVLMQAAKSAQEDLKAIMSKVKAINNAKEQQRKNLASAQKAQEDNRMTPARYDSLRYISSRNKVFLKGHNPDTVKFVKSVADVKVVNKADMDKMVETMKNDLDSMSEMGEMESLRLQMAMDRLSKMMSTLSNILKKISQTADEITQNLK